jgi:hypothetical protein
VGNTFIAIKERKGQFVVIPRPAFVDRKVIRELIIQRFWKYEFPAQKNQ